MESDALQRLYREHNAEEQDKGGRGQRQPATNKPAIDLEASHKLPRIYHQNTDTDQHRGQSNAKCNDQQQAKANSLHRHRAQKYDQCRWAGNDSAADTQRQKLPQRNLPVESAMIVRVTMVMMVAVMPRAMSMTCMVVVMMMLRSESILPEIASYKKN